MFRLLGLLDMKPADGTFETNSTKVKDNSVEIQKLLSEGRTLLGPEAWSGRELSARPTYMQLAGCLVRMMDSLVAGSLSKTRHTKVKTDEIVGTKDKRHKSGKTTRRKRVKVSGYELEFEQSGEN